MEGLTYNPNWVTPQVEQWLLTEIDSLPWEHPYPERGPDSRRVQQYGEWSYNFKGKGVLPLNRDVPPTLLMVAKACRELPNQIIVNEYLPRQGIAPHTDADMNCDWVSTLSLGGGIMMNFRKLDDASQREKMYLERGSLLTLTGPAFFDWKHGIQGKVADLVDGITLPRARRVSVTYRRIKSL